MDGRQPPWPARPRPTLLARVLGWIVLALFLAAIGAALLAGLAAFVVFLVVLIPVLLLLLAIVLTGRGTVRIHVGGAAREPDRKPDAQDEGDVARIKDDRSNARR